MVREIIQIQVGQCGLEIGEEFWQRIKKEHEIAIDGTIEYKQINPTFNMNQKIDVFFES